jgi:hypothetical protein
MSFLKYLPYGNIRWLYSTYNPQVFHCRNKTKTCAISWESQLFVIFLKTKTHFPLFHSGSSPMHIYLQEAGEPWCHDKYFLWARWSCTKHAVWSSFSSVDFRLVPRHLATNLCKNMATLELVCGLGLLLALCTAWIIYQPCSVEFTGDVPPGIRNTIYLMKHGNCRLFFCHSGEEKGDICSDLGNRCCTSYISGK